MQLRAQGVVQARVAFQGTRLVARAATRPRSVVRSPAVHTSCGATPKGLPVSVSTYDDDLKEKSRRFRRTVRWGPGVAAGGARPGRLRLGARASLQPSRPALDLRRAPAPPAFFPPHASCACVLRPPARLPLGLHL
jgi:hypothetical protein